jgi:hypothetical protein
MPRPQRDLELGAAVGIAQLVAEQILHLAQPVPDGLRVHVHMLRYLVGVAAVLEPGQQRLGQPILLGGAKALQRGEPGRPQGVGQLLVGEDDSAGRLASFVTQVLAATGASKVDIVGHSQGGMMPRYYLKFLGGAAGVSTLVGLAPSNHGTTVDGLTTLTQDLGLSGLSGVFNVLIGGSCEACVEQETGSGFLAQLNAGGDTVPGVSYTVIESRDDEVVTPYTSAFLMSLREPAVWQTPGVVAAGR